MEDAGKLALLVAGEPGGEEGPSPKDTGIEVAAEDVMSAVEARDPVMFRSALVDLIKMVKDEG